MYKAVKTINIYGFIVTRNKIYAYSLPFKYRLHIKGTHELTVQNSGSFRELCCAIPIDLIVLSVLLAIVDAVHGGEISTNHSRRM